MAKKPAVPILMYHQIALQPHPSFIKHTVTPAAFEAQMKWLALSRYTPITMDALLENRADGRPLPARPVIITFDDGYQDSVDYGLPTLKKYGFTAVFYLIAGLVGRNTPWLKAELGLDYPLLNWDTARQMLKDGFQLGSHALTHPHLNALLPQDCRIELESSKQVLEEQLDCEIKHLAYPFGEFNEQVRTMALESGYRSACSVRIGLSRPDDDFLGLHRVPVTSQDKLSDFICRLVTAWPLKETVRGKSEAIARRLKSGHPLRK